MVTTNFLLVILIFMVIFTNGPSLVEVTKILKEIKRLLEVIEKRAVDALLNHLRFITLSWLVGGRETFG